VKRSLVIAVIAALTLVLVPAALAGRANGRKVFTANGKVTAVDAEGGTFTMKVKSGARMRSQRGKEVTVNVTDTTKLWRVVTGERTTVALADVKVGERVWTRGTFSVSDGSRVYTAARVKLKATWPIRARAVVTAVDADAGTVTATVYRKANRALRAYIGEDVTFLTTDATRFRLRVDGTTSTITLADIVVDDKVTVWGYADNQDPTDRIYVARRILVRR